MAMIEDTHKATSQKYLNDLLTYEDAAGNRVNRTLRQMSPDEVIASIDWHLSESAATHIGEQAIG